MLTIRQSNRYHKFTGNIQRRNATGYDDLLEPFRFNYLSDSIVDTSANMFKTFLYTSQGTKLVTEQYTGVVVNDRVTIDGNAGLVTKIMTTELNNLAGQRFSGRRKLYLIEVEM